MVMCVGLILDIFGIRFGSYVGVLMFLFFSDRLIGLFEFRKRVCFRSLSWDVCEFLIGIFYYVFREEGLVIYRERIWKRY